MGEASPRLRVTKTKLAIRVAAANEYVSSLGQDNRVILTCCYSFNPFTEKVMNKLRLENVL